MAVEEEKGMEAMARRRRSDGLMVGEQVTSIITSALQGVDGLHCIAFTRVVLRWRGALQG